MKSLLHSQTNQFTQWLGYAEQPLGTDPALQHTVELLASVAEVPVAFIALFTENEQIQLAQVGIEIERIPIHQTFCQFAMCQEDELFIVEDTQLVPAIQDLGFVKDPPGIRFYAGSILKTISGEVIGSMGIVDFSPRKLETAKMEQIKRLGRHVSSYFHHRLQNNQRNGELQQALEEKLSHSEAVKKNQERSYRQLFESITSSHLTITYSIVGKILQANGHFAEFLGYQPTDLLNRSFLDFMGSSEATAWEVFWPKLLAGKTYHGKIKFIHADGKEVWLYSSFCPTYNENGQVDRILQISQDITRQVKIEGELRQSKIKADDLSKQKDIFIANLSHEIRTPINAILGYTDLLIETEPDQVKNQQLRNIQYAGDSLLHLVNDLLDYSKIESGLFKFHAEPFRLHESIENTLALLHVKAAEKGLQLSYTPDPKMPKVIIGDAKRLNQILINLVSNGIKFTKKGGVFVETKLIKPDPLTIQFLVRDTGIGIPADRTEAVFERYHQATAGTAHQYGGTGLGLSICRHLVEKQGGNIWLSSEENIGTTIAFQLTFDVGEEVISAERPQPSTVTSQARILMCEDNEMNIRLAKTLFAKTQYHLDTAPNGKVGIEKYLGASYDLILMDIQMPEMDGLEATFQLRNKYLADIPIIGLSAHALQHEQDNCIQAGMNDYVAKPYKKEELFGKIEFWISKKALAKKDDLHLIDLTEFRSFTGGDEAFQHELLSLLLTQLSPLILDMQEGIQGNTMQNMARSIHTLKGSLGVMAVDISLLADLEDCIRTNHPETIPLARRVLIYLEEIRKESEIALAQLNQPV